MAYLYFIRESDNRKESFFSEIPEKNPIQDEHCNPNSESSESNNPNLPDYLISCVYYCCFYFKYDIERGKMVRIFVAEGLIPEINGKSMEDSADIVIDKLIELGILQVLYHYGSPQLLRLSDSFRSFSFEKLDEKDYIALAANLPVRVKIEDDGKNEAPNFNSLRIQSIFLITSERRSSSGFRSNIIGLSRDYLRSICKLRNLLVLDLDGKIESFPDEIRELVNLRYLCLNCSYLDRLPSAIGDLRNLQTLEIKLCGKNLIVLPGEILNLQQLRHLLMSRSINDGEIRVPKGIEKLINLRTLDGVYAGYQETAKELGNLIQLRKIVVKRVTEDHSNELFAAIMKMENLVSLSLGAENSRRRRSSSLLPDFEFFVPPPFIEEVILSGGLVEIPNWVFSVKNLRILSLVNSNLFENSISALQFLPELKHLALYDACMAKSIGKEFCGDGGFSKLESLTICSRYLVEWKEIVRGGFPSLKHLCFRNCLKLRFVPEGLQNIETLEGFSLMPAYNDIGRRLNGEENYKIKHVPNVRIRELY